MADVYSLVGPAGSEKSSEDMGSTSPGVINETMKAIAAKYQAGDYQGAWEDIMSLPDDQKTAALANPNFTALIRRISSKTDNKLPDKLTPDALGGKPDKKGTHNFGEPLAEHPKPQKVKDMELRTGATYTFDEKQKKWVQGQKSEPSSSSSQVG